MLRMAVFVCMSCCSCLGLVTAAAVNVSGSDVEQQKSVLVAFKRGIVGDPKGALASWQDSVPMCSWNGVACRDSHAVVSIELPGYGLQGSITTLLLSLPFLVTVNLSSNRLQGSIPDVGAGNTSIATQLLSLDLSDNLLTGSLPASIGKLHNLHLLLLRNNNLSGPIPVEIGSCHNLLSLDLGLSWDVTTEARCGINGSIPESLSNCSSLTVLRLSGSRVAGPVPPWLGSLVKLQQLVLPGNYLTGRIPGSLGNLSMLTYLDLGDNGGLEGEVPGELGWCAGLTDLRLGVSYPQYTGRSGLSGTMRGVFSNMSSLQRLSISGTQVNGSIPAHLPSSLTYLDLSANYLSGEIPATLGNLSKLQFLDLTFNDLSGSIPPELGSCSQLAGLFLGAASELGFALTRIIAKTYLPNDLSGAIPPDLGRLPLLQTLAVSYSAVGGGLPSFSNMTALQEVSLRSNRLTGPLPEDMPNSLRYLDLSDNLFTGPIPRALGNLSALENLRLGYNDLTGTLPREIASCQNLMQLSVGASSSDAPGGPRKGNITGPIPHELGQLGKLAYLTLSSMHLSGGIPPALGNCSRMFELQLNDHDLAGRLPGEIANLTRLRYLRVGSNRLQGPLSVVQWDAMASLQLFHFSRNNFSGTLPESFGMTPMVYFMGSNNGLGGNIPPSFRNWSGVRIVDLQDNELGGNLSDALDLLSQSRALQVILLSSNMFEGSIPLWMGSRFQFLSILGLAGNRLTGSIPATISDLPALQRPTSAAATDLILRDINFEVDPFIYITLKNVTLGFFTLLRSTTVLDLSNSGLEGEIPPEMAALLGLRYLNLSHNHFSGPVPLSFSDLRSLSQMDLSNNGLTGTIPRSFVNLANLEYLGLSNNDLEGEIPPFGIMFSSASFLGNRGLCGRPLDVICPQQPPASPKPSQIPLGPGNPEFVMSGIAFTVGCVISFIFCMLLFLSTGRGLHFIFGDTEPPVYIRKHGLFRST